MAPDSNTDFDTLSMEEKKELAMPPRAQSVLNWKPSTSARGLGTQVYLAKLTGPARLLLVAIHGAGVLGD